MKKVLLTAALLMSSPAVPAPVGGTATAPPAIDARTRARIDRILRATPLIDGHNDLPWELREKYAGNVDGLASGSDRRAKPLMTDMARLHAGRVGGQFWSVYIPAEITGDAAIRTTIEQVDLTRRMIAAYPADLALALSADDIVRIHRGRRVASLIGMEGGHQIGNSLPALRQMYALGVRYMTLTHFKNNDWADSATDDPKHNGLTGFGKVVVREMNRLGMLVDLAHVSPKTMADALAISRAPVIFSHSDARALSDHARNVPDDILRLLSANGGVVMVNFYPGHLSEAYRQLSARHDAEETRLKALWQGQPDKVVAGLAVWDKQQVLPTLPLSLVADHIEHVVRIAGHDHVGVGGDLDGIPFAVDGLGSVDGYPLLLAELIRRGWSDTNLAKLAGGNLLRAFRGAEATALAMRGVAPAMDRLVPAT